MSAAVKCAHCGDTGMGEGSDYLDCTYCDAAEERAAFEDNLGSLLLSRPQRLFAWSCYLAGKAAGAAQAVPDGWQAVPVEPTEEMLGDVEEKVGGSCHSCSEWNASWDDCRRVYAAMLRAAPKVP